MNIPCDLHNEHVNKLFKEVVSNMGENITEVASTRAVRAVTSLAHMSERFDTQSGIHPEASAHTTKSDEVDVMTVVMILQERDLLSVHSGRSHHKFPKISTNLLKYLDCGKLHQWTNDKVKDRKKFSSIQGDYCPIQSFQLTKCSLAVTKEIFY